MLQNQFRGLDAVPKTGPKTGVTKGIQRGIAIGRRRLWLGIPFFNGMAGRMIGQQTLYLVAVQQPMEIDAASAKREQKKQNDQTSARPPGNNSIVSKQLHVSLVPQSKTIHQPMASFLITFF